MRARLAATLVAVTVALTGCSVLGGGDDDSGAGTTGEKSVQLADDGTVQGALTSLTRPWQGYDVTVDVLRLKTFDKAQRLEFAVTPRSRGESSALRAGFFSDDGYTKNVGGIYLLDTENLKKYPVLMSSKEDCVCSSDMQDIPLDRPTVLFADFPIAAEGVKRLSVVLPQLGVLPAVEVS